MRRARRNGRAHSEVEGTHENISTRSLGARLLNVWEGSDEAVAELLTVFWLASAVTEIDRIREGKQEGNTYGLYSNPSIILTLPRGLLNLSHSKRIQICRSETIQIE